MFEHQQKTVEPAENPGKLLLVDDDQLLLKSLRLLLAPHGMAIDTAEGGEQAIEKLSSSIFDVVLLDLGMPVISGYDVLDFMTSREIPTFAVVVSGEHSPQAIAQALRLGAYDYIRKPYSPEELIATVKNGVRKKRLDQLNERMQKRLDQTEKLHRFMVEKSPDIIFALDERDCFSFLNGRVQQVLGFPQSTLIGTTFSRLVSDEDQDKARYFLQQVTSNPDLVTTEIVLKTYIDRPDKRYFELSAFDMEQTDQFGSDSQQYRIYGIAREITERKKAEAVISFQAHHDALTGLPNRILFRDRLETAISQAVRRNQGLGVIFIDLDRFKLINDSLGHTVGDCLLKDVAERLQANVRRSDTLSRYGGDEFTLLLNDCNDIEVAQEVARKILHSMQVPFQVNGSEFSLGVSMGISMFPDHGTSADELISNADSAMYRVKKSGKNSYRVFSRNMAADISRHLKMEGDLKRALDSQELIIYFQRLVDTKTENITGVEALIRWNHPEFGFLTPDQFIFVAEESGLIIDLDKQVLRRACRQVAAFHRNGFPGLRLSVNLSPLLLETVSFADDILDILAGEGFPPQLLDLEITENLMVADRADIVGQLGRLKVADVQIVIDDFGTGYSSLSYINKLPVDALKIDRSFVQMIGAKNTSLIDAIISMVKGLNLRVVAEGVETRIQLDYLRSKGCDYIQGFLFGQPCPAQLLFEQPALSPSQITMVNESTDQHRE